jgi:hypothetical protein
VRDDEIDEMLKNAQAASGAGLGPEPEVLQRISASVQTSLRRVRPIAPAWVLTSGLVLMGAAVAIAGAARVGFFGIAKMNGWERLFIFAALCGFAVLAASEFVHAMIPGRLRRVSSGVLLGAATAALLGVFALSFRDYQVENFVSAGVACLITGLEHALPIAVLSWLLLRRGFAVNPVSAGVVAGTLAGLGGLAVLELQCPNFEAAHVMVWHMAVVLVSAAAGALAGWAVRGLRTWRG